MSRYIDIEFILNETDEFEYENGVLHSLSGNSAPSIDIVRCRECKYCSKDRIKWSVKDEDGNWIDTKCNLCRRTKLEVNLDDFCSYGCRDSEKPNNLERSSE